MGELKFFDVMRKPSRNRRPNADEVFPFERLIDEITGADDLRNGLPFEWTD
jgi:hypothetical protein